jgi:glucose/arabinose dehydrogenase
MSGRRVLATALVALCLGSVLAACVPAKAPPPQEPPPEGGPGPPPTEGLQPPDQGPPPNSPTLAIDSGFVTGLNFPWDMAFLSDGKMFFTERPGTVKVRLTTGAINPIVAPADVAAEASAGMMGMAVDPNFASNNLIYACYTTTNDNRVVRWQVNNTFNGVVGATVLVQIPKGADHFGCRIRFGPDGKLWVTTGDAAVGTNPQDLNSLAGKVLRINSDGSAASGNPFINQPGDDRIYTFGHRNPQGIAFQPGTGQPYSIEHGSSIDDEVNKLVAGGNGGWDPVPGYDGYDGSVPMTDFQKFPNAMVPVWRSGNGGTVAPSGGTFLIGSQWKSWANQLVVAFLKDSKARVMFFDGSGSVSFATPILENGVRLRSAVEGPDGNLYIATDVGAGGGAIWKVVPS